MPGLVFLDAGVLAGAVHLGTALRFGGVGNESVWLPASVFLTAGLVALVSTGLYNPRLRDGVGGILLRIGVALAMTAAVSGVIFYLVPNWALGRGAFALALVCAFLGLVATRVLYLALRNGNSRRRVLVLGAGKRAAHVLRFRRRTDFLGIDLVGFIPLAGDSPVVPADRCLPLRGALLDMVRDLHVDQLVVAGDERRGALPMAELLACRTHGTDVVDLTSFIEREIGLLKLDALHPGWLVFTPGFNRRVFRRWVKRLFDIVAAGTGLLLAAPIMGLVATAIWIESRGRAPILYSQLRVGEAGIPFVLHKFRSMRPDAEADGRARWASAEDQRITRLGRLLRRCRLDELPQLYDVLIGRMSFVGPRPERPEFVTLLAEQIPYYPERHKVKPGITGWAQIRYPYGSSERDAFEKLQYDLYYAKNHSLLLDLRILAQTVEVVLWGRGAR